MTWSAAISIIYMHASQFICKMDVSFKFMSGKECKIDNYKSLLYMRSMEIYTKQLFASLTSPVCGVALKVRCS